MEHEIELKKLKKIFSIVHIVSFSISLALIIISFIPNLIKNDISNVMKPMSIAFAFMIVINFYTRR